ncbi:HlyC/CorC family transporter [Candidatus Jorgensenbacteria bacterium]|nr:HlyC/CorC family transporter [Candidatus Jorgensenbacteria bacterium]
MITLLSTILVILILDGIVSAAEAAIFSVSLNRAKLLAEKSALGKTILALKESMGRPIATLISLSNLITIIGSVITGIMVVKLWGEQWAGLFAAILTFLIMVFAEIIPKKMGERYAEPIALAVALPLKLVSHIFLPFILLVEKITGPFTSSERISTSEEEIAFLARVGAGEGSIQKYEGELIQRVFKLNDITAADMMTPKPLVFFLDGNKTLGELADVIYTSKHSRIPVYDKSPNRVIGIVLHRELLGALLQGKQGMLIKDFAKPAFVVPEDKLGDELLRQFHERRQNLAVVVDEHGSVIGVVALEDILEELVGEIVEEKDISPELIKRVSKNEVVIHGQTQVAVFNRFFNTDLPNHRTINGYLLRLFGHVPAVGDTMEKKNIKFTIEEAGPSEIIKVRVIKKD